MTINTKFFLFWSFLVFLVFVMFSYVVHRNYFTQFDFNTTVRLQDHLTRRVDGPFSLLSTIGNAEVVSIILLIILAIRRKLKGIFVLFFFAFFHLFELYGKTFVKHLPPPHFLLRTQQLLNLPQFYVREQNSYPSGHAARAVFMTTIIYLIVRKNKKISSTQKLLIIGLLVLYDITMITSRIYLGEHWTSDTIGGAFLGLSFSLLSGIFI